MLMSCGLMHFADGDRVCVLATKAPIANNVCCHVTNMKVDTAYRRSFAFNALLLGKSCKTLLEIPTLPLCQTPTESGKEAASDDGWRRGTTPAKPKPPLERCYLWSRKYISNAQLLLVTTFVLCTCNVLCIRACNSNDKQHIMYIQIGGCAYKLLANVICRMRTVSYWNNLLICQLYFDLQIFEHNLIFTFEKI